MLDGGPQIQIGVDVLNAGLRHRFRRRFTDGSDRRRLESNRPTSQRRLQRSNPIVTLDRRRCGFVFGLNSLVLGLGQSRRHLLDSDSQVQIGVDVPHPGVNGLSRVKAALNVTPSGVFGSFGGFLASPTTKAVAPDF